MTKLQKEAQALEEQAENEITTEMPSFIPPKGQEHLAHIKIVKGQRFNPNTGEELSTPYIQTFTKSEFRVFESAAQRLGYKIIEILHKPF